MQKQMILLLLIVEIFVLSRVSVSFAGSEDIYKALTSIRQIKELNAIIDREKGGKIRDLLRIPAGVKIVSPHGGSQFCLIVFSAEKSIPSTKPEQIDKDRYRYLLSNKNMDIVYAVYSNEPVSLKDQQVAVAVKDNEIYVVEKGRFVKFSPVTEPVYLPEIDRIILVKEVEQ